MKEIKFPIFELGKDKFQVFVDTRIYSKEAISVAVYKFSDICYIHQSINEDNDLIINVVFESKENTIISNEIPKKFCNELIDQQVRYNTNLQFGHIRDMIVNEAFKPVNSK